MAFSLLDSGMTSGNMTNFLNLSSSGTSAVLQVDVSGAANFASPTLSVVMNNGNTVLSNTLASLIDQRVLLV